MPAGGRNAKQLVLPPPPQLPRRLPRADQEARAADSSRRPRGASLRAPVGERASEFCCDQLFTHVLVEAEVRDERLPLLILRLEDAQLRELRPRKSAARLPPDVIGRSRRTSDTARRRPRALPFDTARMRSAPWWTSTFVAAVASSHSWAILASDGSKVARQVTSVGGAQDALGPGAYASVLPLLERRCSQFGWPCR